MHRIPAALIAALATLIAARAQTVTDPHITSWSTANSVKYARVWETSSDKSSNNAVSTWPRSGLTNGGGGQSTAAYSDIQRVVYSTSYVYIYTTGLPSYTMGNWLTPTGGVYTSWPTNRAAIHRIPRTPSIPTTKQKSNGSGGVLVNGVFIWENGDAQSYTTSTGTVSMSGQGIWNRLAGVAEAFNFDTAYGHQPSSGAYHNHINPIALRYQLGDNVTYNSTTKTYSEATTPTKHSPLIGWANDGLPIYGPYGYSSALDSTSGIRRMTSGFQKRDGTNGSTNLSTTGRTTLPKWAADVQGKSQTLASTEYGPTVTATYTVAPGVTGTYSLGMFAEDYDYMGDLGKTQGVDFDLNRQNVRFCVTPEYPGGTYAYFVSIDSAGATAFPDIINQEFFGTAAAGQGTVTSISEAVTEYVLGGPAANLTVSAIASGNNVALTWNSTEGATYKTESSSDNSTWTTLSSAVTSGGTSTSYTATTVTPYYRVTLTAIATYDTNGTYGTPVGKSATATFSGAATAPSFTTQPSGATISAGGSATFTVVASGTAPLTYQWQKGGATLSGATTASYSVTNAQSADAGSYTCLVTNSAGSATSNAAALVVNAVVVAPTITTAPQNATVTASAAASFTVVAGGTAPLSYQWRRDGTAITGATNATYSITSTQASDAGAYTCVVTNTGGSATSSAATLTVTTAATAPTITQQPVNATATTGTSATFSVVVSGTTPISYQWRKDGATISGATSASYTITSVQATDAGSYTVVATNTAGSITSSGATLTVSATATTPAITQQPSSTTVTAGASVSFSVTATGTGTLTYQWKKDGAVLAGATSATYAIANAQSADAAAYTCVVTNSVGSVTSAAGTLSVTASAVAPSVLTAPANAALTTGGTITLSVTVSGTSPFSYQWKKDGVAISGATAATYSKINVQSSDAGSYTCVVSNAAGSVTSTAATVSVSATVTAPSITTQPASASVATGATTTFSVVATGTAPLNYQWARNGAAISGATAASFTIATSQATDAGSYLCTVTNSAGSVVSNAATLTVTSATSVSTARIINLAVRARIGGAAGTPITGFVMTGTGASKRLVLRAVGPTLTTFGVTSALSDPRVELWQGGAMIGNNDNWQLADASAFSSVGAFALSLGSRDAALVTTLAPGAYTTPVYSSDSASGIVLVECYDGAPSDTSVRLINASARAYAGTGEDTLIPGFVISGDGSVKVLIRAIGPTLANFGVTGTMADPQLTLYRSSTVLASNNDWGLATNATEIADAAKASGAFALANGSPDAAMLVTLSAGSYTANISPADGQVGTVLVEVYVVP
jgi:hypothetical protein